MKNKILKYPNSVLSNPTTMWDFLNGSKEELFEIIDSLNETLKYAKDGLALAANQSGYNFRIFVISEQMSQRYNLPLVIINPKLTVNGIDKIEELEGCLSFPNLFIPIKRNTSVTCIYQNIEGDTKEITLTDLPARLFQHECEHLDGKYFIDNLPRIQKYQILGKYRKK